MTNSKLKMVLLGSLGFSFGLLFLTELYLHYAVRAGRKYQPFVLEPYVMGGRKYAPENFGYKRSHGLLSFDYSIFVNTIADRFDTVFPRRAASPGALKLLVLGASVADGVGASSSQTAWFTILEAKLKVKLGRPVVIERLTMPGYNSTQERIVLSLVAFSRCPSAILVLDGFNDLSSYIYNARPGDPYDQAMMYESNGSIVFSIGLWLSQRSEIINTIWRLYFNKIIAEKKDELFSSEKKSSVYINSVNNLYSDNILNMAELCKFKRTSCSFIMQPARASLIKLEPGDDLLIRSYQETKRKFSELRKRNISAFDLSAVFQGLPAEKIYRDRVHFNDEGQRIIADAIEPIAELALSNAQSRVCD